MSINRRFYKKVPAEEIRYQPEIYKYLRERVKGQDTSLNGMAATLSIFLHCREAQVFKIAMGGAVGSGKKTTIQRIKQLLAVGEGEIHAAQFVEIHGSTVSEDAQKSSDQGIIALFNRLKKASRTIISTDTGKEEVLPYICLFIDEIDKASISFMDCMSPLFERGRPVTTATGKTFSLPRMTPLLLLFTTNCASTEISRMAKSDDVTAAHLITRALEQRWSGSTVTRCLQPVLPYYPLNNETLEPILMEKFDEYVQQSALRARYGTHSVQYSDDVKSMLVKHVLARIDISPGVQGSIGQLFYKLNIVFAMGLGVIQTMVAENAPLLRPIVVTAHSIDTHRFAESLDKQLANVINEAHQPGLSTTHVIDSILDNPENHQIINECDTTQEGTVEAVTMAYGDRPLCSLVVNITYNNYHIVNHVEQHEEMHNLKQRMRSFKSTLKEIIETVDHACSTETSSSALRSTMKKIVDTKRDLIEASSSDESDEGSGRPSSSRKKRPHSLYAKQQQQQPQAPTLSLGPLSKRPRIDEEMLLDFSDEIELYTTTGEDYGKVFIEEPTRLDMKEEEEESEDILWCTGCDNLKPMSMFIRKRKGKNGVIRATQVETCSTCRKGRK